MSNLSKLAKYKDVRKTLVTRGRYSEYPITRKTSIAIHHSLTLDGSAEAYARFHVQNNGWQGIGYHIVIEKNGTIKHCNDLNVRSYHVGNANTEAIGVCLTGDFRKGRQKPTKEQLQSLRDVVKAIKKDVPSIKEVKGHNEYPGYEWKNCPGDNWNFKEELAATSKDKKESVIVGSSPQYYEVQEGDTLWGIARAHRGVTVDDIVAFNKLTTTTIHVGQKLRLENLVPRQYDLPVGVYRKGDGFTDASERDEIVKIQTALNKLHFSCGNPDGFYGGKTESAIRRFQTTYLPHEVDGIYGKSTRAKMLEELEGNG